MKTEIIIGMGIALALIPIIMYATNAFGVSISPTTTLDNTNRRMYTWCPLNATDISSFNGEIDTCPMARVYVNNWNTLSLQQQQTVDKILTAKGFVDAGQNPSVK